MNNVENPRQALQILDSIFALYASLNIVYSLFIASPDSIRPESETGFSWIEFDSGGVDILNLSVPI